MSRKGSGTIEQQKLRLQEKMEPGQVEKAKKWALEDPDAVRFAFRCLKSANMGKRDLQHYNQIAEIDPHIAEVWKRKYFG